MTEIAGAIVGAVAVICIPLIAWFSRRATREGRLMLRVERLGSLFALMPDSPERETFKIQLTGAIGNLNAWLNPGNIRRRKIIKRISTAIYLVGVLAALVALPSVDTTKSPWFSSAFGAFVGVAISAASLIAAYILERTARRQASMNEKAVEDAAAELRMDALRRGEMPSDPSRDTLSPSKR